MTHPHDTADGFRAAMSRLAAGVVMVTCHVDGKPWGLTVSACCSVSMDPLLLLVSLGSKTASARSVRETVPAGDHTIFIGDVGLVITHERDRPLVPYERAFHRVSELSDGPLAKEAELEPTVDSLLFDYPVPRTFSRGLPLGL
jgi:flavin reductase (DIM6/NTAB) family NADH-FMN oxidoreductase RutF